MYDCLTMIIRFIDYIKLLLKINTCMFLILIKCLQDLEAALLTDGTEEFGNSLLQELIARLLSGCFSNRTISTSNYQMFLRRLFREKCKVSSSEVMKSIKNFFLKQILFSLSLFNFI